MDIEKIRIYLAALDLGSYTAAADALGYTTSGISRSIASLEEELEITLFTRGRKGVSPTPEAQELIPLLRETLAHQRLVQEKADQLKGIEVGTVTIGVSYAAFFRLIARKIKEFSREHPRVEVKTVQCPSSELLRMMDDRLVDLAVMTERPGNHRFIELIKDPMVICVSKNNPLAQQKQYPLEKLAQDPMVVAYPNQETDYQLALKQHDIRPNIRYATSDVFAAYCMVEADLGVSLSNRLEVASFEGNVALLPTDPPIIQRIGVSHPEPQHMSHAAKAFLNHLLG